MEKPALKVLINGHLYDSIDAVPEDIKSTMTAEQIEFFTTYQAPSVSLPNEIMSTRSGAGLKLTLNGKSINDLSQLPTKVQEQLTPDVITQVNQSEWNAGVQFINPSTGQRKNIKLDASLLFDIHEVFLNGLAQIISFSQMGVLSTISRTLSIQTNMWGNILASLMIGQVSFWFAKKYFAKEEKMVALMPEQFKRNLTQFQFVMKSGEIALVLNLIYYASLYIIQHFK